MVKGYDIYVNLILYHPTVYKVFGYILLGILYPSILLVRFYEKINNEI